MATNLLISYAGIEASASIQAHTAEDSLHVAENAIRPDRSTYFKLGSAAAGSTLDFDLETGNTAQPDHLIFCRWNKIIGMDTGDPTLTVYGDDNSSFSSPETFSDANITISQCVGPDSEDYINEFSPATAYRYWRVRVDTTSSEKHEWTYVRLGNWFDMGRDPVYGAVMSFERRTSNERRAPYRIDLTWEGVSDAKLSSFLSNVVETANYAPLFLYDQNDYLLNEKTLLACSLSELDIAHGTTNANTVSATFEELI